MWIRSQNKTNLEKVDAIAIRAVLENSDGEERGVEGWSIITLRPSTYTELGIYETRERAVGVMDEIQSRITENVEAICQNQITEYEIISLKSHYVFQMPLK